MSQNTLTIHPLNLGTFLDVDKSTCTLRCNQGIKIDAPSLAYVILGGRKTILVDTGPCDPERAVRYHRPLRKETWQEMPNALARIGLKSRNIDLIILTHLHWDHCSNLEYFSGTPIAVQKKELEYAVAPLPIDRSLYEASVPGIHPPWMKVFDMIAPVEGDKDIMEGVRVMYTPGHTPGFQSVVIETEEGPWIIAGDMTPLYENWKLGIPAGIYQDLYLFYDSLEKLKKFGDKVLPGHDGKVLEHARYPVR